MKRIGLGVLTLMAAIGLWSARSDAVNPFEQFIRDNLDSLNESISEPFGKAFSTGVTGGIYRSAGTHGVLGFDVGLKAMFVLVPSGESPSLDTADVKALPIPAVQAALGLPMDTELMLRGFAVKYKGADISLLGVGLKKNFSPLIPIPMFPDVAAMISYHRFSGKYTTFELEDIVIASGEYSATIDAGELMKSSHWSFDLIASKKLSLMVISLQPYVGIGFDRSSIDFEWTLVESDAPQSDLITPLTVSGSSDFWTTRLTLGLDVSPFPFVHVYGDYNIGKFPQATLGLAISFR
jgi:hypothetical protein